MVTIELDGDEIKWDKLTINIKRKFVKFNVYIDGCGQFFTIEKEKLKNALK